MTRSDRTGSAFRRGLAALAAAVFVFLMQPARAQSAPPVETYIQGNIQTAVSILSDKSLSFDTRRGRLHDFLLSLLDTKRIALFALGPTGKTASPADLAAYEDAFRDFMSANYVSRLNGYGGQTLKVTGSVEHGPGDFVVSAILVDSSPTNETPPEVDMRVVDEDGTFHVVDVSIEGIWLALAQRDDFQSFLGAHNGDVAALTAHLKDMTAKLLAPAP